MKYKSLPPAKIVEPSFAHLSVRDRVAVWMDLVDTGVEIVLAGQRRRTKNEEEQQVAFRKWLDARRTEHDQAMQRMMEKFRERRATV